MADLKSHMSRHLRSAKQWLTRAEESFDKDSNIRGELDLFLAQAELQHARETNYARQWRYKYPLIRHVISFTLAAAVAAFGVGAYWWIGDRNAVVAVQPAVQQKFSSATAINLTAVPIAETPKPEVPKRTESVTVSAPVPVPVSSSQVVSATVERQLEQKMPDHTEKENILPPDEMAKIVKAAGKSLRGQ